jgi:N-acetylglucosamine-6-phosphate deacetylase
MNIIDIHTHGISGYDTRTSSEDHILKIAEIHGTCGVSEILLAVYPASIKRMRENMEAVRKAMEKQKHILPPVPPPTTKWGIRPAKIIGLYLEGPFLNPALCGSLEKDTFLEPSEYSFQELLEGFEDVVKIMTVAPEINGVPQLIKKISDKGIIVSLGHSDATYAEAEAGFHAGAKGITHLFNAMRGIHHREPGIAGFGLINPDVYIEVIADPFHLHGKILDLIFKTKNPEKIVIVSDTVSETNSKMNDNAGTVDTHGRLLGGSLPIPESAARLIEKGYDEEVIMNCIAGNPERYLSGKL